MTAKICDCSLAPIEDRESKALETPIECGRCHAKLPATAAFNFEGADYIYYFCGPQCLDAWCKAAESRSSTDFSYLRPWLDTQEYFALSIRQDDPRIGVARQILAIVDEARRQLLPSADSTANYVPTKQIVEDLGRLRQSVEQYQTPAASSPDTTPRERRNAAKEPMGSRPVGVSLSGKARVDAHSGR